MTATSAPRATIGHPASSTWRQVARLCRSEIRLFARDPQAVIFVFAFPVITVLVLGGVFGTGTDDSGFEFVNPQHFYSAAYFGVVLSAVALIMLPVHVAGYRERGVLRRFDTSGLPRWAFPLAVISAGIVFAALGFVALLITAELAFGLPPVDDWLGTIVGVSLGTLAMISLGVALGSVLPTARAAQGVGLLMFFPMFLLAGGGPPPEALSDTMRSISEWLPLTHVIRGIQEPWLGLDEATGHHLITLGLLAGSTLVWVRRTMTVSRVA